MMNKLWIFTCFCIALTFHSIDTKADPVYTHTLNGGFSVTSLIGHFNVTLSGAKSDGTTFSALGAGASVNGINVPRPTMAPGGTSINLSGSVFLGFADISFPNLVIINGNSYTFHTLDLTLASTSVTLPFSTADTLSVGAPCTVNGGVTGGGIFFQAGAGFNGLCGATLNLRKSGTDAQGNGLYTFQSISYGFRAAPTPEPTTVLLLATGIAGVVAKVTRRRSHKE